MMRNHIPQRHQSNTNLAEVNLVVTLSQDSRLLMNRTMQKTWMLQEEGST
jgi:hypothetical protein